MRTILDIMYPEKQSKPIQAEIRLSLALALSHLESGHAAPFYPQDFCSPCVFVYGRHNTGSYPLGSASTSYAQSVRARFFDGHS